MSQISKCGVVAVLAFLTPQAAAPRFRLPLPSPSPWLSHPALVPFGHHPGTIVFLFPKLLTRQFPPSPIQIQQPQSSSSGSLFNSRSRTIAGFTVICRDPNPNTESLTFAEYSLLPKQGCRPVKAQHLNRFQTHPLRQPQSPTAFQKSPLCRAFLPTSNRVPDLIFADFWKRYFFDLRHNLGTLTQRHSKEKSNTNRFNDKHLATSSSSTSNFRQRFTGFRSGAPTLNFGKRKDVATGRCAGSCHCPKLRQRDQEAVLAIFCV